MENVLINPSLYLPILNAKRSASKESPLRNFDCVVIITLQHLVLHLMRPHPVFEPYKEVVL